jgi:hypothetical protein
MIKRQLGFFYRPTWYLNSGVRVRVRVRVRG